MGLKTWVGQWVMVGPLHLGQIARLIGDRGATGAY